MAHWTDPLARHLAALTCSRMTDQSAQLPRSCTRCTDSALKVMTTVTDSAFNLVCLHLQVMIMVYIIIWCIWCSL